MPRLSEDEAAHRPKEKRYTGLLPLQNQMYSAMAAALLAPELPVGREFGGTRANTRGNTARSADPELPRPRGNSFYPDSRYFYQGPKEPDTWRCTACVECSDVFPAPATVKCYSCAKYDARRKGLFCKRCFDTRHPWHRQNHTWLPLNKAEDLEDDVKGQRVRAEMDHRITGIEELLQSTAATRRILEAQSSDTLPSELVGDTRTAINHAESEVGRVRRKLHDDVVLRELVALGKLDAKRDAPSRGWGGPERRSSKPRPGHTRLEADYFVNLRAALVIQKSWRRYAAGLTMRRRIGQVYHKAWDEDEDRFYFVKDGSKEVSWEAPRLLKGDLSFLLTPRTFSRRKKNGEFTFAALHKPRRRHAGASEGALDAAALVVQCAWRRRVALNTARALAARQWQRVKDPASGRFYFVHVKSGRTSWKRPRVFGGNKELAERMIQTPRGFSLRLELERRGASGGQGEAQPQQGAQQPSVQGGEAWDGAWDPEAWQWKEDGSWEETAGAEGESSTALVLAPELALAGLSEADGWDEDWEEDTEWTDNKATEDGTSTVLVLSPPRDVVAKDSARDSDGDLTLADGWEEVFDPQGSYFVNRSTGERSWSFPGSQSRAFR